MTDISHELSERIAALETSVRALCEDVREMRIIIQDLRNESIMRDAVSKERDRIVRIGMKVFGLLVSIIVVLGSLTVWLLERAEQVRLLITGGPK